MGKRNKFHKYMNKDIKSTKKEQLYATSQNKLTILEIQGDKLNVGKEKETWFYNVFFTIISLTVIFLMLK